MKTLFREIALCRDGGSLIFEFEGNDFFLDYGIGSETRGVIFHGRDRGGAKASKSTVWSIFPHLPDHYVLRTEGDWNEFNLPAAWVYKNLARLRGDV